MADIFSIIKYYAQTITAGGVIAALLISLFGCLSQRRHNYYERLVEVYKMINDFGATFDHIGTLFATDVIPKKPLLKALWGTGRIC